MDKNDIVYVLINTLQGKTEMATTNDYEAWTTYRDSKGFRIQIFIKGDLVASIEPKQSALS